MWEGQDQSGLALKPTVTYTWAYLMPPNSKCWWYQSTDTTTEWLAGYCCTIIPPLRGRVIYNILYIHVKHRTFILGGLKSRLHYTNIASPLIFVYPIKVTILSITEWVRGTVEILLGSVWSLPDHRPSTPGNLPPMCQTHPDSWNKGTYIHVWYLQTLSCYTHTIIGFVLFLQEMADKVVLTAYCALLMH